MSGAAPAITVALFEIGKILIGIYIGKESFESTYGSAAPLVVLLIWVYFSSQNCFVGAEFPHICGRRHGSSPEA